MLHIGIVAGEISGDILGADLISSIIKQRPDAVITGVGGEQLKKTGCQLLYPLDRLAVMGISEVFGRYFELLKLRRSIRDYFIANPPDVFIGVDAPDFNLPLERMLREHGIKTIHYVSPSVWAWREYRLRAIARSVDLMLILFPFEKSCYEQRGIPVCFTGHPLARKTALLPDRMGARQRLGLAADKTMIAIMPGSRKNELERHVKPFLEALNLCNQQLENLCFASSLADAEARSYVEYMAGIIAPALQLSVYTDQAHDVMEAADVILLASGTVALEAMLLKRPMVVAYKVNWLTCQLAKRLLRVPYVSLPNLLAGRLIVPECLQQECTPEILTRELLNWLRHRDRIDELAREFTVLHLALQADTDELPANAVLHVIDATA